MLCAFYIGNSVEKGQEASDGPPRLQAPGRLSVSSRAYGTRRRGGGVSKDSEGLDCRAFVAGATLESGFRLAEVAPGLAAKDATLECGDA